MNNDLLADVLQRNLGMIQSTLADFSDAEMFIRPCPGANHTAWQLGHLIASEVWMLSGCNASGLPALPAGFADKFTPKTASIDDPAAFAPKAQLLDLLAKVRAASIQWVNTLTPADMSKPGPEKMRGLCPTVGHVALLLPDHVAMHMGQMQVVRRKLGKPILF
jgi:hypothetical protein